MTLVASALAGGDCIDDADTLRAGRYRASVGLHGQAAIHPGDLSAQFPVGPLAPVGSDGLGVAGPGMYGWGRTGRGTADHRPGFHGLRDLRTEQGGRPLAQLSATGGSAGLSPAVGHRRWNWSAYGGLMARLRQGRANTALGAAHFLLDTISDTISRVRCAGAAGPLTRLRRTGRQRLLHPRYRDCLA